MEGFFQRNSAVCIAVEHCQWCDLSTGGNLWWPGTGRPSNNTGMLRSGLGPELPRKYTFATEKFHSLWLNSWGLEELKEVKVRVAVCSKGGAWENRPRLIRTDLEPTALLSKLSDYSGCRRRQRLGSEVYHAAPWQQCKRLMSTIRLNAIACNKGIQALIYGPKYVVATQKKVVPSRRFMAHRKGHSKLRLLAAISTTAALILLLFFVPGCFGI